MKMASALRTREQNKACLSVSVAVSITVSVTQQDSEKMCFLNVLQSHTIQSTMLDLKLYT